MKSQEESLRLIFCYIFHSNPWNMLLRFCSGTTDPYATVAKNCLLNYSVPLCLHFAQEAVVHWPDIICSSMSIMFFWLSLLHVSSFRELYSQLCFRWPPRLQAALQIVFHNCLAYRFPLQAWVWGRMESKRMCQWERGEEMKRKTKQHPHLISLNIACIRYPLR